MSERIQRRTSIRSLDTGPYRSAKAGRRIDLAVRPSGPLQMRKSIPRTVLADSPNWRATIRAAAPLTGPAHRLLETLTERALLGSCSIRSA